MEPYLLRFKLSPGDILTPDPLSSLSVYTIKKLDTDKITIDFLKQNFKNYHYHVCGEDIQRLSITGHTVLFVENNVAYTIYDLMHESNISFRRDMLLKNFI